MSEWKWYIYQAAALIRGLLYQWPDQGRGDFSGVSCGFRDWRESRAMFKHGWVPWTVQRTSGLGTARLFRVHDAEGEPTCTAFEAISAPAPEEEQG